MKRYLFILAFVLFSCSSDDEKNTNSDILTSYSQPYLGLGETEAKLFAELGEPNTEGSQNHFTKYTYLSDTPGIQSIEYLVSNGEIGTVQVNLIASQANLNYIKDNLQNSYNDPIELEQQGGLSGLRYSDGYAAVDLHYSTQGLSVLFIEYFR